MGALPAVRVSFGGGSVTGRGNLLVTVLGHLSGTELGVWLDSLLDAEVVFLGVLSPLSFCCSQNKMYIKVTGTYSTSNKHFFQHKKNDAVAYPGK